MDIFPIHRSPFDSPLYIRPKENTFARISSSLPSSTTSTTSWSSTDATSSSATLPLNNSGLLQTIQSMYEESTIRTLTCVLLMNLVIILIIITVRYTSI